MCHILCKYFGNNAYVDFFMYKYTDIYISDDGNICAVFTKLKKLFFGITICIALLKFIYNLSLYVQICI